MKLEVKHKTKLMELFQLVYNHPELHKHHLLKIKKAHSKIKFNKGYLFLEQGEIASSYYLIEKGLVRSYVYNYNGMEITTGFYGSNSIVIEVSSLFQRIPTNENFKALTSGVAWKIEFPVFQELYHQIESFNEWGRAWMSNQLFESRKRNIDMVVKSAADRYLMLLKEKPEVIQQAPLKHIASYLGITDSSLSRVRKEFLSK